MLLFVIAFIAVFAIVWVAGSWMEAAGRAFSVYAQAEPWPHRDIILTAAVVAFGAAVALTGIVEIVRQLLAVLL